MADLPSGFYNIASENQFYGLLTALPLTDGSANKRVITTANAGPGSLWEIENQGDGTYQIRPGRSTGEFLYLEKFELRTGRPNAVSTDRALTPWLLEDSRQGRGRFLIKTTPPGFPSPSTVTAMGTELPVMLPPLPQDGTTGWFAIPAE